MSQLYTSALCSCQYFITKGEMIFIISPCPSSLSSLYSFTINLFSIIFSCHNKLPQMKRIKNKRNLFSDSFGSQKSELKVQAGQPCSQRLLHNLTSDERALGENLSCLFQLLHMASPTFCMFLMSFDSGLTWSLQDDLISTSSSRSPKTIFPYKLTFIGFGQTCLGGLLFNKS